jgi:hypothetical protein
MLFAIVRIDLGESTIVEGPFEYTNTIAIRLLAKQMVYGVSPPANLVSKLDCETGISIVPIIETVKPVIDDRVQMLIQDFMIEDDSITQVWDIVDKPLEGVKEYFIQSILDTAETKRNEGLTPGSGKYMAYIRKGLEAEQYIINPNGSYPLLEEEAILIGITVSALASEINAMANAWNRRIGEIEGIQRSKTTEISIATLNTEIITIFDSIIWP